MHELTLILLSAGSSSRFGLPVKKQWIRVESKPLWQFVADNFAKTDLFSKIIITAAKEELTYMRYHDTPYHIIEGGSSRQESLQNALKEVDTPYVLVSDIARCCIDIELIHRLLVQKASADVVVPAIGVSDTVIYHDKNIDRDSLLRIQTPQLSKTEVLKKALQTEKIFTDESSAIVAYGGTRAIVEGSEAAHKLTYASDLTKIPCLKEPSSEQLIGSGFDVHEFDTTKESLYLCGEKIECGYGFKAHSDGDVAIHALIDALLGATGMGDIGELFPDTDEKYRNIDSKELLKNVTKQFTSFGFEIVNVDLTIIAQKPKIAPHKLKFRQNIYKLLELPAQKVNIKATTTEKLGFIGRSEGVAVSATANVRYYNYKRKVL